MTQLGKILVFINLVLSLAMAGWAGMIYAQRVDWSSQASTTDPSKGGIVPRLNAKARAEGENLRLAEERSKASRTELLARERLRPLAQDWYAGMLRQPLEADAQTGLQTLVMWLDGTVYEDKSGRRFFQDTNRRTMLLLPTARLVNPDNPNDVIPLAKVKPGDGVRFSPGYPLPDLAKPGQLLLQPAAEIPEPGDKQLRPLRSYQTYQNEFLAAAKGSSDALAELSRLITKNQELTQRLLTQKQDDKVIKGLHDRVLDARAQLKLAAEQEQNLQELETNARNNVERLQRRNEQLRRRIEELKGAAEVNAPR